jgi:hypothetical protein
MAAAPGVIGGGLYMAGPLGWAYAARVLSALTVLLIIAGVVLVPYTITGGVVAFVLAFVVAGAAYRSRHDLETFMGLCLICGFVTGCAAWIGKLW